MLKAAAVPFIASAFPLALSAAYLFVALLVIGLEIVESVLTLVTSVPILHKRGNSILVFQLRLFSPLKIRFAETNGRNAQPHQIHVCRLWYELSWVPLGLVARYFQGGRSTCGLASQASYISSSAWHS
jgi:hypothetical protein